MQFSVLPGESEEAYRTLLTGLYEEHQPGTFTEKMLVEKLAQHFWLSQRAQGLADTAIENEKQFALFLRYQTTNDRAFHKCLDQLLKLRAEKRKEKIGFESQKQEETELVRKQELTQAKVRLANAKAADLEFETELRS